MLADRARTSPVFRARTSFTVRRSPPTFAEVKSSASSGRFHSRYVWVRDRKRRMVSGLNELYLDNYKKSGAEFIFGSGRFIGPRTVEATLARWNEASTPRNQCDHQYGHTRCVGFNSRPCRGAAAHPYRSTGTGRGSRTSPCHRRWLRRDGTIPGHSPIRQQGIGHRTQ